MDCTIGELFGLDVELPDKRTVRVEGSDQTDACGSAKAKVMDAAGMDAALQEKYVLVYYGCWMGDEFQLNAFGCPWNGTQLEMREKLKLQQEVEQLQRATPANLTAI